MAARKKVQDEGQSIDEMFKTVEPKIKVDPDTGLVEQVFEEDEKVDLEKQLWAKNPRRSQALLDLWYDELQAEIDKDDNPEDAKKHLSFLMTANAVMDMIMECIPEEMALDLSYALDHTIALSLVNKKYDCDLLEEERKAVSIVKREDYDTDDDYARAVEAIDDHWWTISQPQLDMRNANDAIIEMMAKYKLNE
ncbi:MAG: hypothetical protein IJT54_02450 [Candidatus Methanomethylophilaceae archaeon]|nr:hypothetical protein [Candidatus Methanomethylophilaceae archaeon]